MVPTADVVKCNGNVSIQITTRWTFVGRCPPTKKATFLTIWPLVVCFCESNQIERSVIEFLTQLFAHLAIATMKKCVGFLLFSFITSTLATSLVKTQRIRRLDSDELKEVKERECELGESRFLNPRNILR